MKNGKFNQQWDCKSSSGTAFVQGGMWFTHENNSLHVPVCGWYYVSSTITFQSNSNAAMQFTHSLKIDRNCNATSGLILSYAHATFTMIGPLEPNTSGKASTIVTDIVKICEGGRIYVNIPTAYNSCCPFGTEAFTSITAYLVSESDCYWPLPMHTRREYQRSQR